MDVIALLTTRSLIRVGPIFARMNAHSPSGTGLYLSIGVSLIVVNGIFYACSVVLSNG